MWLESQKHRHRHRLHLPSSLLAPLLLPLFPLPLLSSPQVHPGEEGGVPAEEHKGKLQQQAGFHAHHQGRVLLLLLLLLLLFLLLALPLRFVPCSSTCSSCSSCSFSCSSSCSSSSSYPPSKVRPCSHRQFDIGFVRDRVAADFPILKKVTLRNCLKHLKDSKFMTLKNGLFLVLNKISILHPLPVCSFKFTASVCTPEHHQLPRWCTMVYGEEDVAIVGGVRCCQAVLSSTSNLLHGYRSSSCLAFDTRI